MGRTRRPQPTDATRLVGCCGAYCRTCRSLALRTCPGCKTGYDDGSRSMARARCRIKVCCFGAKKLATCAECDTRDCCDILKTFHGKKGNGYGKYGESLEFVRANGYLEFVERAKCWERSYGDLSAKPGHKSRQ